MRSARILLCVYVYGSAPEEYADLPEQLGFSDRRTDLCVEEYQNTARAWLMLLDPYLREVSPVPG